MNDKQYLWYQIALSIVLNVIDYVVTKIYVSQVGVYGELNPIQFWAINNYGTIGMLYLKLSCFLLLIPAVYFVRKQAHVYLGRAMLYLNLLLTLVIGWGLINVMMVIR